MLIFRKEAEQDLQSAYEWYESQRESLGREFVAEVESKCIAIDSNPHQFRLIGDTIRRAICSRFPYSIYFLISEEVISVIGVLHQRRNPATWQRRT